MLKYYLNILLLMAVFHSATAEAKDIIWDLGVGVASINLGLYPGSADKNSYVLPFPYFTLISKKLEIDRGIRGFLFESDRWLLDVSADFGIPVDSEDSKARAGMPKLDSTVQFGPSLEYLLADLKKERIDVRFELPLRAVFSTNIKETEHEGWLIEPRFSIEKVRLYKSGLNAKVTLGVKYATRGVHAYYYDVDPLFETPARPAYTSSQGFGGVFMNLTASWREGDWIWWTWIRYQNLNSAVFADSPLVEQKDYYLIGAGFAWVFAQNL